MMGGEHWQECGPRQAAVGYTVQQLLFLYGGVLPLHSWHTDYDEVTFARRALS